MRLKDYIQGDRRGKEANRFEREAMLDPFTQEAIDGFDSVEGNHAQIIEQLEKKINIPKHSINPYRKILLYSSIAASILLLFGVGFYFLGEHKTNQSLEIALNQQETKDENEKKIDFEIEKMTKQEVFQEIASIEVKKVINLPAPATLSKTEKETVNFSEIIISEEEKVYEAVVEEVIADVAIKFETVEVAEEIAEEKNVVADMAFAKRSAVQNKPLNSLQSAFGENEFQTFCKENAAQNICDGKNITVKLTFYIDKAGRPSKIKYKKYTCDDAKKEMEKLLATSPEWTERNRKIGMTVEW